MEKIVDMKKKTSYLYGMLFTSLVRNKGIRLSSVGMNLTPIISLETLCELKMKNDDYFLFVLENLSLICARKLAFAKTLFNPLLVLFYTISMDVRDRRISHDSLCLDRPANP